MGYIEGEGRNQGTLFPVMLDDFVAADHMCRVIDAFVEACSGRCDGKARLQSARFVETLSIRLLESDSLVAAIGSRVPSKCRADVASRTLVSGPQEHR